MPQAALWQVQVKFTDNTFSSIFSLNSNVKGDPLFIGLKDLNGNNIAGIAFDMINSGSNHDFASGTLSMLNNSSVPEPNFTLLLGGAMAGLAFFVQRRKRAKA